MGDEPTELFEKFWITWTLALHAVTSSVTRVVEGCCWEQERTLKEDLWNLQEFIRNLE